MKKATSKFFSNRLAQYGALSIAIAGTAESNGQIIYTDIDPDEGGVGVQYLLDMDDDGADEFGINQLTNNMFVGPLLNTASILGYSGGGFKYPYAMDSGLMISAAASGTWLVSDGYYQTMNFNGCAYTNSDWCGVTDKYLGLRFDIGGQTHYGWAQLDVALAPGTGGYLIKGFAYNTTAGDPIEAGQTTLSVESNVMSGIKIISLNKSIGLYNLPETTKYSLFSMTGQKVMEGNISQRTYVVEAASLATGVYVVEITDANTKAVLRKKIVL